MIGQTLSHYRITEKLGQGGMGEVYRAEDTNLSRQVAIKVLPDIFAGDPERLARFEREAKLLASLNHPNIAAIHGLEEHEGKRFLVLELVEGQTLAERLHKGPLPVEEALDVCRQIAEGLEAAHEKGVIHRDLKPANVKVTPEGKVKVLDFGLARALHDQAATADQSHSPTITDEMTRPGVVLGTAAYMSPEQAKGKTVDKRADIWAFGCVLYECLTGKRTFQGDTITETVAAILKSEPDWALLPADTLLSVRAVLRHCLQKEPARRLHDIADARLEIAEVSEIPSIPETFPIRKPARAWLLLISGLLAGAAAAALIGWYLRPTTPTPVVRFAMKVEPGHWLEGMRRASERERPSRTAMAISSDGGFVVYSAIPENPGPQAKSRIFLRKMDKMEAVAVAGTEGGISPIMSPDDRWIGFWEGGKLKKVAVSGGVPIALCQAASPFGADWGPDNRIVFSPGSASGLSSVSAEGGDPQPLTAPDKAREESSHRLPHFLPDGRGVLFTVMAYGQDLEPRLAVLNLDTREWREVMKDAADGRYLRTGHLVFLRQGILMAAAFDLNRLEVRGQPVPVVAGVTQALNIINDSFNTAAGQFDVSDSGWFAYAPGGIVPDMENSLVRVDLKGNIQPVADFKAPFFAPRFSPEGLRIAYLWRGRERRLFLYDLNRGVKSPLTEDGRPGLGSWTPDGKRLVFGWLKSGPQNLYWQPVDGSSSMEQLAAGDGPLSPGSFTPDGSTHAFVGFHPQTRSDILLLDVKTRRVTPFLNSKAAETHPEISPDGHWIAYASDESGRSEVWVRPFPDQGGRWQVSNEGGLEPVWSKDGRQLFYRWQDQVWVVDIRTEAGLATSKPRRLFKQRFQAASPSRGWDLAPDGRSFLMVKQGETEPEPVTELILVQNWLEDLKRLVPTGK